jgi:hypothetical protein
MGHTMTTTAIFAEIIVVGLQCVAWILVLVLGLFGTDWIDPAQLRAWAALATIVVVAAAYAVGVIVDRLADDLFLAAIALGRRLRGEGSGSTAETLKSVTDERLDLQLMRFTVADASEGLGRFLDYQRARIRVARATTFNLVAAVPATTVLLTQQATPSDGLVAFLAIAAIVGIAASARTAVAVHGAWKGTVQAAYEIVTADRKARPEPDID